MTEYALTLPINSAAFTDKDGRLTTAGRGSLNEMIRRLQSQITDLQSVVDAIVELETGQADITDVLTLKADKAQVVVGSGSIKGGGTLENPVILALENDQSDPGGNAVYGTDVDGAKGWMALGLVSVGNADTLDGEEPSFYLDRTNHTGVQAIATVTGLQATLDGKQPLDTDLTAIAALSPANDDVLQRKAGAWTNRTMAQLLADLGIAAAYQPLDATLTALSGQNWAANALPIGTGADTVAQVAFAANTFPARGSAGDLVAKAITDDALLLLADADVPRIGTANSWGATQTIDGNLVLSGSARAIQADMSTATINNRAVIQTSVANSTTNVHAAPSGTGTACVLELNNNSDLANSASARLLISAGVVRIEAAQRGTGTLPTIIEMRFGATISYRWETGRFYPVADATTLLGDTANRWGALHALDINLSGAEFQSGIETTATLSANTDNLAIASTTRILRINTSAAIDLTGIVAPTKNRRLTLINVSGNNVTLIHNATSTAANQFRCPGGASFVLNINDSVDLWYDLATARWRVLGF